MLFNSYIFLFLFLPVTFTGYFLLSRIKAFRTATLWLVLASLFFYSFWNPIYLPLILVSLFFNYSVGKKLANGEGNNKKALAAFGVTANVLLLGYYKYADFFIENTNIVFSSSISLQNIVLPLAISFFTFQQIAYIIDSYKGLTKEYSLLNYSLFVTFFPQLISGPIVHHKEMMPQFIKDGSKYINYRNVAVGIFVLSLGLFKKTGIADTFAIWANNGFNSELPLSFFSAWSAALAYTFQLYFDFSGYTDMAIGVALMFNISLPINFNSPYKALNIQDFWRRWHITLTRFLRDYIYIPLGGNRKSATRTRLNFITVFLVGGLWHGPMWTFVVWGAMHGVAMAVLDVWKKHSLVVLPKIVSWTTTFMFVVFTWVIFRADSFAQAISIWKGMLGFNGINFSAIPRPFIIYLITIPIVVFTYNSIELRDKFKTNWFYLLFTLALFGGGFYMMSSVSEFLYFNF